MKLLAKAGKTHDTGEGAGILLPFCVRGCPECNRIRCSAEKITMKHLLALLSIGFCTAANGQGLLTFDEVSPFEYVQIPNGYGSVYWNNFYIQNGSNSPGFLAGAISQSNVAFTGFGNPGGFSSPNRFTLKSAYFTAVYVDTQEIRVEGFRSSLDVLGNWVGPQVYYDKTYVINKTAPTLLTFDFADITNVRFTITSSPTGIFAMDNLVIVPEPSTGVLLATGAVLGLAAFSKLKVHH